MSFITDGVVTVLPAPEGYVVNFDDPRRNGDIATYWIFGVGFFLATLFLVQRLYVKVFIRRNLGLDDACLVLAWMILIVTQAIIIRGFALKFIGVHAWEMPIEKFEEFVKYSIYLSPIIYAWPTALAKLVLLLFYLQLQNSEKWFKWSIYVTMFIDVGSSAAIFFSAIFVCKPIAMGWDITITTGHCIDRVALFEATAVLGVITDVLIILIPIPMVLGLHVSRAKKTGLFAMFTIGSATVITSIVRLVLLITSLSETDQTWGGGPICLWICIESNLLVMCASIPTLRLFFKAVAPGLMSSSNGAPSKTTSGALGGISRGTGRRGLQTIASVAGSGLKSKRQEYGRFDEESGYGMETLVVGGPREKNFDKVKQPSELSDASDPNNMSREWNEDGNSDQGIVMTTTTEVAFSK